MTEIQITPELKSDINTGLTPILNFVQDVLHILMVLHMGEYMFQLMS